MSIIQCPNNREELKQIIKQNKNKYVFIKFYADWCKPCKDIDNKVEQMFNEMLTLDKLLIYVNVDEQQDVASYFKIRKLPTLISFENGERSNVITGTNEKNLYNFFYPKFNPIPKKNV